MSSFRENVPRGRIKQQKSLDASDDQIIFESPNITQFSIPDGPYSRMAGHQSK